MEPGTSSSRDPAPRSSCSRNSGLPSARSTQAVTNEPPSMTSALASDSASARRSGPRSIVSNGVRPAAARHAWSSGSPSTRDVIRMMAGQSPVVALKVASCAIASASAQWTSSMISSSGCSALARFMRWTSASRRPLRRVASSMAS